SPKYLNIGKITLMYLGNDNTEPAVRGNNIPIHMIILKLLFCFIDARIAGINIMRVYTDNTCCSQYFIAKKLFSGKTYLLSHPICARLKALNEPVLRYW